MSASLPNSSPSTRATKRPALAHSVAARHQVGLLVGTSLSLVGLVLAIGFESMLAPLVLLSGWITVTWSTHRLGRSGPMSEPITSHYAARQSRHFDRD